MTRISILHVAQPVIGGVARVVAAAAADQAERDWRVAVASPADGELAAKLPKEVDHLEWGARRAPAADLLGELASLRAILGALRPDLVHLHSSKAMLAGRLVVRRDLPTIVQPHAWSFWALRGAAARAARAWERQAARWTDVIVCVSEAERTAGLAAGIRAPYAVIANGIDVDRFAAAGEHERTAARAHLGLPSGPLAVFVGRLERQKGADILLSAWPHVLHTRPDAYLAVVGDGDERSTLTAMNVPAVTFAGAQADVREWLAAADVAVFPSRWEAGSLAVLEALAIGRSVVATDVAGMREAIQPGTGALVAAEDPAALASALAARLGDQALAAAEGAAARESVVSRHSLAAQLEELARLAERVAARKAPSSYL